MHKGQRQHKQFKEIGIEKLEGHPDNANRMDLDGFEKLCNHMRQTGRYPAVIVRCHPSKQGCFEILDGHHRVEAARVLGHARVRCDVWEVEDEEEADTLLLTLNRLRGEDDPVKRGAVLMRLRDATGLEDAARRVPDDLREIRGLIALQEDEGRPGMVMPQREALETMPYPVTFFLSGLQRKRLLQHLGEIAKDRTEALVRLLALDEG